MALPNGYSNYANNKIMTASPAQLTLMLYDGAIKFCNIAIAGMERYPAHRGAFIKPTIAAGKG